MREKSIMDLKTHQFSSPPAFGLGFTIVVATSPGEPITHGSMFRVSPEEPVFAFIIGLAEAISNGASDEDLAIWRKAMLAAKLP